MFQVNRPLQPQELVVISSQIEFLDAGRNVPFLEIAHCSPIFYTTLYHEVITEGRPSQPSFLNQNVCSVEEQPM